jgi:hypothetical protein
LAFINKSAIIDYVFPEKEKLPLTPLELLENLKALNLHRQSLYQEFYTSITDIIRSEVMHRTGYIVSSETTEELLNTIQSRNEFDALTQQRLRDILLKADPVKFGRLDCSVNECEKTIDILEEVLKNMSKIKDKYDDEDKQE